MPAHRLRPLVALALAGAVLAGCVAPDADNVKVSPTTASGTVPDVTTSSVAGEGSTGLEGGAPATDPVTGEPTVPADSSRFVTLPPTVLYDSGASGPDCGGSLSAGTETKVAVTGKAGTPTESLTAVLVNVVVTDAAGPGVVTVWNGDADRPTAPTAQLTSTCDAVVKLTIVPVGPAGKIGVRVRRRG